MGNFPLLPETVSRHLLQDKVIIVTGGNSGIGKAIVETAGQMGAKVVIDYRSHPERTEEIIEEIGEIGGQVIGVQADVSKLDDIQRLIDTAVDKFGKLDVMVNNAGIETRTSILDTTPEDFDKVLNVNLRGVFFATQYAAHQMIKQGTGGRIINISSVHEDWPMPNNTPYCVAKGGVACSPEQQALNWRGRRLDRECGPWCRGDAHQRLHHEQSRIARQTQCRDTHWPNG